MKPLFLFSVLLFAAWQTNAQATYDQISAGPGYTKASFYRLDDGSSQQIAHDAWDIAFSNLGATVAGIFINESSATINGQPTPALELFDALTSDFSDVIDPGLLGDRLYNPEIDWTTGAFNTPADPSNPLDFGWGTYNPVQHQVQGSRVFVLKLRNGQYRKLIFDVFTGSAYTFRVAELDNANAVTYTVELQAGNGSPLQYVSLANPAAAVATATNWDMVFCRYFAPLDDGSGGTLQYALTGILSGDGVLAAKASGVDPATVDYNDYLDSLSSRLDVVGHDWKAFDLSAGWSVAPDRAYFVKTTQNQLFKLVFIDFEGSSTGAATVERTALGVLSAAPDLPAGITAALVYPNPTAGQLTLSFTAEVAEAANLSLVNTQGQLVWSGRLSAQTGLNVAEIALPELPQGQYFLSVQIAGGRFVRKITVGA